MLLPLSSTRSRQNNGLVHEIKCSCQIVDSLTFQPDPIGTWIIFKPAISMLQKWESFLCSPYCTQYSSFHIQTRFQWYQLHKSPIDFPKHSSKSILVATSMVMRLGQFSRSQLSTTCQHKKSSVTTSALQSAWVQLSQRRRSPTNKGSSCTVPWYTLVFKRSKWDKTIHWRHQHNHFYWLWQLKISNRTYLWLSTLWPSTPTHLIGLLW